jgi:hypothetical protein
MGLVSVTNGPPRRQSCLMGAWPSQPGDVYAGWGDTKDPLWSRARIGSALPRRWRSADRTVAFKGPYRSWNGSWNGALSNPSSQGASRAMSRAVCAASARGAPGRASCKRQVRGEDEPHGNPALHRRHPSRVLIGGLMIPLRRTRCPTGIEARVDGTSWYWWRRSRESPVGASISSGRPSPMEGMGFRRVRGLSGIASDG